MFAIYGFLAERASAASGNTGGVSLFDPLAGKSFQDVVQSIAGGLATIALPIVGIMVLYGGFQLLTAGGDPEKYKSGKNTILYAVIGYAVILLANGIVLILRNLLGV